MTYQLGFPSLLFLTLVIASFIATLSSPTFLAAWIYTFFIFIPSYYIIYQSWIFPFYISPLRFVPTVPGFPLWGQTLTVATEEVGVPQRRWHKQHGPILRWFLPFGVARLSVIDDEALRQILIRNPYVWRKPPTTKHHLAYMLGDGVFSAEEDAHVQQRKALAPGFSISSIKALSPVFWRKALLLSQLWRAELRNENAKTKSIEVLEWLGRTTLDIMGEAGFGTNFDSLNHPETPMRMAYQRVFNFDSDGRLFHGLLSFTTLAKYLPMRANRELVAARRTAVSIASEIIRDKQSKKLSKTLSREKDIIALIVRDNSTANGKIEGKMTFETMRDQVMTFIGAGHETNATAMVWTLHLLSKYPSTQEKLRREIQDYMPFLFSHSREDESWLSKIDEDRLPYLNNVCRESLRYIPPVPLTRRENTAEDQLCGYRIPVGTHVYIPLNTIHRAPEFWGETADVFDPDRWDHLPESYTANAYIAFLYGPRGCIGRKFAETEMKTLLCCLLSMYRFEIDDTVDDPENWKMWRITLRPKDGITLKVTLLADEP
ncbi:hypothetical protein MMC28_009986 [Mycoblastus sanguinarius]|nr:hypothetical protein [Mycoblastus sanguinarius]